MRLGEGSRDEENVSFFRVLAIGLIIFDLSISLAAEPPTDITYEWLEQLIKTENLSSVQAVIEKLPDGYKKNFVLMRSSASIQGATLENPRVIMFGKTARLMMTFNGHPKERGFDRLEMIEFNDQTKKFDFKFIAFKNGVKFSPPNNRKCIACHSAYQVPIWTNTNYMPGAYGTEENRLRADEMDVLKNGVLRKNPRYKPLFEGEAPLFPYEESSQPTSRLSELINALDSN